MTDNTGRPRETVRGTPLIILQHGHPPLLRTVPARRETRLIVLPRGSAR